MMLTIVPLVMGPVQTNCYLVGEETSRQAVVIDPAWDGEKIQAEAARRGWEITAAWLTHAHFDHVAGSASLARALPAPLPLAIHPDDLQLYQRQGGAAMFGLQIEPGPTPTMLLSHGQSLSLGPVAFEVRHTPGHTPGHVVFYSAEEKVVFCGDVIFRGSIGRTDLPGSSYPALIQSIETQLFSLPDETVLYSGHGPQTSVGIERRYNPFLG
jgi:glyoxylase-like metal-dependent hydrolase (beta-lactamase superfamily II)